MESVKDIHAFLNSLLIFWIGNFNFLLNYAIFEYMKVYKNLDFFWLLKSPDYDSSSAYFLFFLFIIA